MVNCVDVPCRRTTAPRPTLMHRALLDPTLPEGYLDWYEIAAARQDWAVAQRPLRVLIRLRPDEPIHALRLVLALRALGQLNEASAYMGELLRVLPGLGIGWQLLGDLETRLGNADRALGSFITALIIDPSDIGLWAAVGQTALAMGHADRAVRALGVALRLGLTDAAVCYGMAQALTLQTGRPVAAVLSFLDAALGVNPALAVAMVGRANHLRLLGALDDASRWADRACRTDPSMTAARLARLLVAADGADWRHRIEDQDWVGSYLDQSVHDQDRTATLRALAYQLPFLDIADGRHRAVLAMAADSTKALAAPAMLYPRPEETRLRLGYISSFFGDQPMGHVVCRLLGLHDRRAFHLHLYALIDRQSDRSDHYQRIRSAAETWRDLSAVRGAAAAQIIAEDNLDILVDLDGYMTDADSGSIIAARPARLVVHWLGHGGSMGADYVDYLIGDAIVLPPGVDHEYRESLVRLPRLWHPADRPPIADNGPSRADCGLAPGQFVFASFNHPKKIDPTVFAAWMAILEQVPKSILWLHGFVGGPAETNLRGAAVMAGIDPTRLVFAARLENKTEHLARIAHADLFLDCFTVNAATTALDALWAGLPVLTVLGDSFFSRMSASMLHAAGLESLIVPDVASYVRRAVHLARSTELTELRQRWNAARHASPLFDADRFARELETAYRSMWAGHIAGQAPAAIWVTPSD